MKTEIIRKEKPFEPIIIQITLESTSEVVNFIHMQEFKFAGDFIDADNILPELKKLINL
jgi:hypothetical protein